MNATQAKPKKGEFLETKLKALREWALLREVRKIENHNDRSGHVAQLFAFICSQHDDEHAVDMFDALCQSEEDAAANAQEAQHYRAIRTMALWPQLPNDIDGEVFVRTDVDDGERRKVKQPTMLRTKRAMLDEIARAWAKHDSAEAAAILFRFLCDAKVFEPPPSHGKDKKPMLVEALREATGRDCKAERLFEAINQLRRRNPTHFTNVRHIDTVDDEVARVLMTAVARNEPGFVLRTLRTNMQMYDCSEAAVQLLDACAAKVRAMDTDVKEVCQLLGYGFSASQPPKYRELKVTFPELGVIALHLVRRDLGLGFNFSEPFNEAGALGQFQHDCGVIKHWLETHPYYAVEFQMSVPNARMRVDGVELLFDKTLKLQHGT